MDLNLYKWIRTSRTNFIYLIFFGSTSRFDLIWCGMVSNKVKFDHSTSIYTNVIRLGMPLQWRWEIFPHGPGFQIPKHVKEKKKNSSKQFWFGVCRWPIAPTLATSLTGSPRPPQLLSLFNLKFYSFILKQQELFSKPKVGLFIQAYLKVSII